MPSLVYDFSTYSVATLNGQHSWGLDSAADTSLKIATLGVSTGAISTNTARNGNAHTVSLSGFNSQLPFSLMGVVEFRPASDAGGTLTLALGSSTANYFTSSLVFAAGAGALNQVTSTIIGTDSGTNTGPSGTFTAGLTHTMEMRWDGTDVTLRIDGVLVVTQSLATVGAPVPTLEIMARVANTSDLLGFHSITLNVQGANVSMTIDQAVDFLRNTARNGTDTSKYTTKMCHMALQGVCDDFVARTQPIRTTTDYVLSAGQTAYTITTDNFRPELLLNAYLTAIAQTTSIGDPPTLFITAYSTINDLVVNEGLIQQPTMIAFDTLSSFAVYPIPDINYTLRLLWDAPFTQWAAGDTTSSATTILNMAPAVLRSVIRWGGVYFLQGNEPENKTAMERNWKNYLDFVERSKSRGVGSMGQQVSFRTNPKGRTYRYPRLTGPGSGAGL